MIQKCPKNSCQKHLKIHRIQEPIILKCPKKIKKNGRKNTKEDSTIKYRYMKKGDKENGRIRKRIY